MPVIGEKSLMMLKALAEESRMALLRLLNEGERTVGDLANKKTQIILRWLATLFEPDRLYGELEVNGVLKAVYAEDYISLRRDLVDMDYLRRERNGGKYWLGVSNPAEINP
jgi:hypothetical protein